MALTAESLGLGCSGFDSGTRGGVLFHTAFRSSRDGDRIFSDFAFNEGGFACLPFLKNAMMSLAKSNDSIRAEILKCVESTVLNISRVRGFGDDNDDNEGRDRDGGYRSSRGASIGVAVGGGDIRFVSWLSGLLMTVFGGSEVENIAETLFHLWCPGLLSSSMPFRLITQSHVAIFLNHSDFDLPKNGAVRRWFSRLRGRVVRRLWCERASAPVYSRYLQTLVDLLVASKERLVRASKAADEDFDVVGNLKLDSTVPCLLPRPYLGIDDHVVTDDWLVFRSYFSIAAVEDPALEAVKKLGMGIRGMMDGGEGPPMLDVGMTVLRGEDWNNEEYGREDGWEEKKAEVEAVQDDLGDGESVKEKEDDENDVFVHSVGEGDGSLGGDDDDITDNISTTSMGDVSATSVGGVADDDNSTTSTLTAATTETESSKKKRQKAERKKRKKEKRSKVAKKRMEALPLGEVVEICDFEGVKGAGRKVKWAKTGIEKVSFKVSSDSWRIVMKNLRNCVTKSRSGDLRISLH